jgi:hypothetical protein
MLSYDGMGYGMSVHWQSWAKATAECNGEICRCWYDRLPRIDISIDGTYQLFAQCVIRGEDCPKQFPKTNQELTYKFRDFYGQYERFKDMPRPV